MRTPRVFCSDDSLRICNETASVLRSEGREVAVVDNGFLRAVMSVSVSESYSVLVLS